MTPEERQANTTRVEFEKFGSTVTYNDTEITAIYARRLVEVGGDVFVQDVRPTFDIRFEEVQDPQRGDTIEYNGDEYVVDRHPVIDALSFRAVCT